MPTYGATPEGFVRPSVQELKALFEQDQRAEISPTLDLSTESVLGQLNGIYARHLGLVWEAEEVSYNAIDPDKAEAALLTAVSKLTGTDRRGAQSSETPCTVNLDPGVTLLAGVHFAHVNGDPDTRFTPKEDITADLLVTANYTLKIFRSEVAGEIQAPAGQLTIIATPVVGWNNITNTQDAGGGREIDDDPTLRTRREAQLAAAGSATLRAIRSDLLELEGIESVLMFENIGEATDANGVPGHSIEAVIWDGSPGIVNNDEIAQIIFDGGKAGGIRSFGTTDSGTAVDENGDDQIMGFTRASVVPIYLEFDVLPLTGYVGDSAFKAAVAESMNAALASGDDVVVSDAYQAAAGLKAKITEVRMGTAALPLTDDPINIGIRQIARFDTTRIVVDSTP